MRKFLIVFGLFVIAAGVALSIIALVTAEDQSQQWQNNTGQSTCVVDTETTPAVQRCQFDFKTPYQGEMSLVGLTLALTGIGVEVAALALVARPAPPHFPNFGPPPITARAG